MSLITEYIVMLEDECCRPGFNGIHVLEVKNSLSNWKFDIKGINELLKALRDKNWITIPNDINEDDLEIKIYPTFISPNYHFNQEIVGELKEISDIIDNPQEYSLIKFARLIKRGKLVTKLLKEME